MLNDRLRLFQFGGKRSHSLSEASLMKMVISE
jgi:hypothetical protein